MSKKMSKFFGLLLAVCMLVSAIPNVAFAAGVGETFIDGSFTYKVNTDGTTVTLTAIAADSLSGEVVIPETVTDGSKTYTVTTLAGAFKGTDTAVATKTYNMTKLVMADTITSITVSSPFYACRFTEIHLSSALTGDSGGKGYLNNTFNQCNLLATANVPAGITMLYGTFLNAQSIKNVIFEGTTTRTLYMDSATAASHAFKDGSAVNLFVPYLETPSSMFARMGSGKLTPTYYYYDGDYRFSVKADGTAKLDALVPGKTLGETVVIPNTLGGKTVTELYMNSLKNNKVTKSFTMPDTVKAIDSGTFYGWIALENVHLSSALVNGGAANQLTNTFHYCSKLTNVTVPAGITQLYGTFRNSGVKTVTLKTTSQADFYAGSGTSAARAWTDGTTGITIYYPADGVVPTRYTASGSFTATAKVETVTFTSGDFTYVTNGVDTVTLTAIAADKLSGAVTVPATVSDGTKTYTVTQLGDAFKNQVAKTAEMTSLVLPDTITKFTGTVTFYACKGLTSIKLPANLTGDGQGTGYLTKTFHQCNKLTAVELPVGITKCYGTFYDNSAVRTVTIKGTSQVDFFAGSTTTDARAWANGTTGITIYYPYGGTAPTRTSASGSFTATVKMIMPTFTEGSFNYVLNADGASVTLLSAAETLSGAVLVPANATYNGNAVAVTAIGNKAFANQTAVTSLTLPNTVTKIGYQAFMNMDGLTSFDMPDSVTTLDYGTFYDCSNLEKVNLSKNLTGTLQTTFAYCYKLKDCVIPEGVTTLNRTFMYCNIIKTVVVPASVTTITGDNATDIASRLFSTFDREGVITGAPTEPGFVVMGYTGSAIETYMNGKGWNFKAIDATMPLAIAAPRPHLDNTVTVDVANFAKADDATGKLVFCAYYSKADGSLVDVGITEVTNIGAVETANVTVTMTEGYDANTVYLRAYVWEVGTFNPLAAYAELYEEVIAE